LEIANLGRVSVMITAEFISGMPVSSSDQLAGCVSAAFTLDGSQNRREDAQTF
jgi:hypothetical protein